MVATSWVIASLSACRIEGRFVYTCANPKVPKEKKSRGDKSVSDKWKWASSDEIKTAPGECSEECLQMLFSEFENLSQFIGITSELKKKLGLFQAGSMDKYVSQTLVMS
ncbi:hypothetical protein TNCV_2378271 [Trichonephila clavipes]|nr:hypothetical protein TNCV_2378271 [Trichonephila clavipes]